MSSDGERYLEEMRLEARAKNIVVLKALGIWAGCVLPPATLIWVFAISRRAAEALGEWYFAGVFVTAFVLVPILVKGLR